MASFRNMTKEEASAAPGRAKHAYHPRQVERGSVVTTIRAVLTTDAPLALIDIRDRVLDRLPKTTEKSIRNALIRMEHSGDIRAVKTGRPKRYALSSQVLPTLKPIPRPETPRLVVGETGAAIIAILRRGNTPHTAHDLVKKIKPDIPDITIGAVSQSAMRMVARKYLVTDRTVKPWTYRLSDDLADSLLKQELKSPPETRQEPPGSTEAPRPVNGTPPPQEPPASSEEVRAALREHAKAANEELGEILDSIPPPSELKQKPWGRLPDPQPGPPPPKSDTLRAGPVPQTRADQAQEPVAAVAGFYDDTGRRWVKTNSPTVAQNLFKPERRLIEVPITSRPGIEFELVDISDISRMAVGTEDGLTVAQLTFKNGTSAVYVGAEAETFLLTLRPTETSMLPLNQMYASERARRKLAEERADAAEARLREWRESLGEKLAELDTPPKPKT